MSRLALALALALGATLTATAAPDQIATDVGPARTVPPPFPSVRLKGLERFDTVELLEGGVLCGIRAGYAPACATDPTEQAYAAPYEALDDVVGLQALGTAHCVLFGTGELRCIDEPGKGPTIATPSTWPVLRRDVTAFRISATSADARVFALDRTRTLHVIHLAGDPTLSTTAVVAKGVTSFGWRDWSGACAIVDGGDVLCSDPAHADDPLQPTAFHHAAKIFDGGAILRTDGSFTYVLDSWAPFAPWPAYGSDYNFQLGSVVTPQGSIECANTLGPWVKVTLPAAATRLAPGGYISCAALVDGTTACYGPFLSQIERLAKRPRRSSRVLAR
ncbi:MAG TPA: hypothetical protein VGM90_20690 [Kofleriaceae bacterium]|jgi:hypothetical protein